MRDLISHGTRVQLFHHFEDDEYATLKCAGANLLFNATNARGEVSRLLLLSYYYLLVEPSTRLPGSTCTCHDYY